MAPRVSSAHLATIALVVSIASLLASFRSCQIAGEGYKLQKADFEASRLPVFTGRIVQGSTSVIGPVRDLLMIPTDSSLNFQSVVTYTALGFDSLVINGTPLRMDGFEIKTGLIALVDRIPAPRFKPLPGYITPLNGISDSIRTVNLSTPMVIRTNYTRGGERFDDLGLYNLLATSWMVTGRAKYVHHPEVTGLEFVRHLPARTDPGRLVAEEMKKRTFVYYEPW